MRLYPFKVRPTQAGLRLDDVLHQELERHGRHTSKTQLKKWIRDGHLYLNEKRCRICSKPAFTSARLALICPDDPGYLLADASIVYEDDHLLVLDKPPGLSTQATLQKDEPHLYAAAIVHLTRRSPQHLAYVGLHHRLDRDTSGLVLMSKKKSANKNLSQQFKKRQIEKTYLALSTLTPEAVPLNLKATDHKTTWQVKNHLGRIPHPHHRFFFGPTPNGAEAISHFQVLTRHNDNMLISAHPKTGRTHQLRIHLAQSGLPLVGDRLYGRTPAPRLFLHAYQLGLQHPISQKKLLLTSTWPEGFPPPDVSNKERRAKL